MKDLGLIIKDSKVVVGSREVAEKFGKRHDHILRDIENLIEELGTPQNWGHLFIENQYQHPQNNQLYKEFLLTRDGFSLLVMGFTGKKALNWKIKYIEAFNKMEEDLKKQLQFKLPGSYVEALRELASTVEEKEKLTQQNQLMAPKAEMYDILLTGDNAQSVGEVAKSFGIGRNKLFDFLRERKVLISKGTMKNTPYQRFLDNDYFEVREVSTFRGDKTINVTQTMITPKGIDYIGKILKQVNQ